MIEVAERVVEAERFERAQVDAAGRLELLRLLELPERAGYALRPLAVDREIPEAASLQRELNLLHACRSDRERCTGVDDGLVREELYHAVGGELAGLGIQERRDDPQRVEEAQVERAADVEALGLLIVARGRIRSGQPHAEQVVGGIACIGQLRLDEACQPWTRVERSASGRLGLRGDRGFRAGRQVALQHLGEPERGERQLVEVAAGIESVLGLKPGERGR